MVEVGKLFGFRSVLFILNNTKVKVPLALAATILPAPILMHLEYKVRLPDLNIAMGTPHNLIPLVYGVRNINLNGEVTYLGDTFIRIYCHCVKSVQIWSYFWSIFSRIRTEYGDLLHKSLYSI